MRLRRFSHGQFYKASQTHDRFSTNLRTVISFSSSNLTTPPPLHLILDWDGTLTTSSTLPLIAQIGYDRNASSLFPSWDTFSEAYMSDYRAHASAYRTPAFDRKTVTQELAWLESLRDMERKSVERAEAAGIIRNVGREDVRRGAEPAVSEGKVRLRKGWKSLIMEVLRRGGRVDVVSVTWSGTFVTTCLRSVAEGIEEPIEITNQGAGVWANEIRGGNEGRMDRYFENDGKEGKGGIWTAGDKMRVMNELTALEIEGEITVYVGDSTTDLQCLLSADVGVCIRNAGETSGEQRELEQTLRTLGVGCQWIGRMNPDDLNPKPRQDASEIGNRLWWATNFDEICQSPLVQTDASAEKNNASILVYNMPPCYQSSEPMILQSLQGLPVGRC